jgi:Phosphodiester glycosidase
MARALRSALKKHPLITTAGALMIAAILAAAGAFYAYGGAYGFNVVLRRGSTIWVTVRADDPRLSPSMRQALQQPPPPATPGPFAWRDVDAGFAVGELPVLAEGREVDRILLARIDPQRFRFVVRNAPSGGRELGDWMAALHAVLVINGSYFATDGTPDTPFRSDGIALGPRDYKATHGAFVASPRFVGIRDLAREDWRSAFDDAPDALVSYPLLLAADGSSRAAAGAHRLANRSFVAEDGAGRIILGTTTDAFFSLDRLAGFLRDAPLNLTLALNLDGGPVACQGIALDGYRRDFCGRWELAERDGALKLWQPLLGTGRAALPIVLAVLPK